MSVREMCHRGVMYITDFCNAKCPWCYYQSFLTDQPKNHLSLEELKSKVEKQRNYYNLGWTDLTGKGEPTLHPNITEIVKLCAEAKLKPTVITNGLLPNVVDKLIAVGLDDLLLSVHGVGEIHDSAVAVNGAFGKVLETLKVMEDRGFRFRTNTVLTKLNMENLPDLAEFLSKHNPKMVNFICFNPHEGTEWSHQSLFPDFQAKYSEIRPHLSKAIDILTANNIWANVRYFPLCQLPGYEKHICNYHQHMYDPMEWNLCDGFDLTKELMQQYVEMAKFEGTYGSSDYEKLLNFLVPREVQGNFMTNCCRSCINFLICDGLYSVYTKRFGFQELSGVEGNLYLRDPIFYRLEDLRWMG